MCVCVCPFVCVCVSVCVCVLAHLPPLWGASLQHTVKHLQPSENSKAVVGWRYLLLPSGSSETMCVCVCSLSWVRICVSVMNLLYQ